MILTGNKNIISLFCWIFFLFYTDKLISGTFGQLKGYTDIVLFRDTFIAVGTDGRIDRISNSGEIVSVDRSNAYRLNCAFSNDGIVLAAGNHGTILHSSDGRLFNRAESRTDKNIYGITSKNGMILAGTERGIILNSKDGKSWGSTQTEAKGHVLSLSANHSFFIGVTDSGEILKSFDGIHWDIQDYNKAYAGYNVLSIFKKIVVTPHTIVIIGTHDDGSPSILFSSLGTVWAERLPVYYDDEGRISYLTNNLNDITFDSDRNQFILACDNGEVFSLPNCTKCNKLLKLSGSDLNVIIYIDHRILFAGEDYSVFIQRL